jgi:hypothetical protein
MEWAEESRAGFALAATLAHDRGALLARAGLCTEAQNALCALPALLASMPRDARRAHVAELARSVARAAADEGRLPALLDPARMRPGFVPERSLIALLRRLEQAHAQAEPPR